MKISEIFKLNKSQFELDFVDIDTSKDTPLFLDPYFISKLNFPFAISAYGTIHSFFDYLILLLQRKEFLKAKEIFNYLGEANELCLGLSKGTPSGKGMGPSDTTRIFKNLLNSRALKTGLMEDIEDFRIFVPNVDKDKISDMTANIIRKHLVTYTQIQCNNWGIPLTKNVPSGYFWNEKNKSWDNEYTEMLVYNNKKILLVPKSIVSYSNVYTSSMYKQHFVLNFLQNENLKFDTHLVKYRKDKTPYVNKKDIENDFKNNNILIDKNWLANFTLEHKEVFNEFKERIIDKIISIDNKELTDIDLEKITRHLISKLKRIPPGSDNATIYQKTVLSILELLFYPYLGTPQSEVEINDGRKRIDITFDNCAETGFFHRLAFVHNIPSSFIMVECKNYSVDLKNPEIDQLIGRFNVNRGKFGLSLCRKLGDMNLFIKRCQDTYKDGQGLIIPIVDEDLIEMLEEFPKRGSQVWEEILQDKFRIIAMC